MNLDPEKVLVLFVIALLVLGPNRLPQAARALGKGLAELRKYTSAFQSEVNQVLAEPRNVVQSVMREVDVRQPPTPQRPPLEGGPGSLPGAIAGRPTEGPPDLGAAARGLLPGPIRDNMPPSAPDDPGLN